MLRPEDVVQAIPLSHAAARAAELWAGRADGRLWEAAMSNQRTAYISFAAITLAAEDIARQEGYLMGKAEGAC
jgi:hypothetical protein